jgi:release factor glutamine methyltransferase
MPDQVPIRAPILSVLEVLKKTSEFFASKGIESARLNAELLISHVLAMGRMELYLRFDRPVSDDELAALRELVRRRGKREPLQYVLGFAEFHGLRLKADRRALIPRPETEYLVETVLARCTTAPSRIVDLGTGTGAIALALAKAFPEASVTAVDASPEALSLAIENAATHGLAERVSFLESDWLVGLAGMTFDLIVSNPPYLSEGEVAATAPEVREHEPMRALASGVDGFADVARIITGAAGALAPGGLLALETGIGHHARASAAARNAGFSRTESVADLTGRDRIFLAWR